MKWLVLLGLVLVSAVVAGDVQEDEDVLVLTDDNFDSVIAAHEFVLVEFYAPWCGHCKKLAPEFSKAAKTLKELHPVVPLAKVDCTVEKKTGEKFEVKGYPTLKFFTNGQPIEYGGGRTDSEIVDWIKKKILPPSSELKTIDSAEKLIADHEVAVVYFGEAGTEEHNAFIAAARSFDDVVFAHTSDASIAGKYEITDTSSPKVVLFKKFDEGRNDFTGKFKLEDLKTFVDANQYATLMPFTQKAAQKIFGEGVPALFLFTEGEESGKKAEEALKTAAATLKGKIILSVSGVKDGLPKRLAEYVGVAEKDVPTIRIVDPGHDDLKKFTLDGDLSAENIIQFFNDWKSGKLKAKFKTQDLPENDNEPVKTIVGLNFKDIVLDESKDVLVEYYAPWCGHCKSLAPIYDKLAKKLEHITGLVLGKMDSTANEVEGVKVTGFPTIKFYPANKKKSPIDFTGDRTEEGFIKFLKEHMTVPFVEGAEKTDL